MLNTFQDVLVIIACISAPLAFLFVLRHFWPSERRGAHNEIIGWQVSVLGTTYAVIIGFMLYAVWTAFQVAELNADAEANSLVNVYRLADGLPATERVQVHQLARQYANIVIEQEWPTMNSGALSHAGHDTIQGLWTVVMHSKPATISEQTAMNLMLTEISNMTEHRRVRQLESQSKLPGILWLVMILGGGITTLSACLFGTDNFKLHCLQIFSLTLLLSLILVAIADIDRPFQGVVHVSPQGFERARATFAQFPIETQ
jgi:uncharacterized protein DUF4239